MSTKRRRGVRSLAGERRPRPRNRQATEEALKQAQARVREAEQLLKKLLAAADSDDAAGRSC